MVKPLGISPAFPDPSEADENGLLAYGGDLNPDRLLTAYSKGIFPWPHGDEYPLLWFSPDPRTILIPKNLHIGASIRKVMKRHSFEIRFDTAFESVILACAVMKRKDSGGTWITQEMMDAYARLHHLGFAHSAEAWQDDQLVGGLYGVSLGAAFFGESMFSQCDNASKVALITLLQQLNQWDFHFFDCQMPSSLVTRLGAVDWKREYFLASLKKSLQVQTRQGKWQKEPLMKS
ncbi:MAG: leucyl/phenylalanyl-tRNA--protein transferase [Nitrospiria bacterium]